MSRLLEHLNPPQLEAVIHPGGPCLILAGAGSGKTRVLTHRVAWLIQEAGVPPGEIVAVTFTNKAAREMRERVRTLLGGGQASDVFLGTFHSWCVRLLRKESERIGYDPSFTIYDTPEQLAIVKKVMRERNISETTYSPKRILGRISAAKNKLETPESVRSRSKGPWGNVTADVFTAYQESLERANAFDFDDLLARSVQLLESDAEVRESYQQRVKHLLVDEYQDTNHAQYRLIKVLTGIHKNLTVVGDEDQSIFSWRGADISNILDFERDFPDARIFRLEQNYRSSSRILSAALSVVSQNENRKGKELWTENDEGELIVVYRAAEGRDEASWVVSRIASKSRAGQPLRDMAIMYRTHAQSRLFEEELLRGGIPYVVLGGVRFYQRREVKDLLAYLTLSVNPNDPAAFMRILNVPARGIGKKTEQAIEQLAAVSGLSLYAALEKALEGGTDLSGRAISSLRVFHSLIETLRQEAQTRRADQMVEAILRLSQYMAIFDKDPEEERLARKENMEQFVTAAGEAVERGETIPEFLSGVALQSDIDALQNEEAIPLMSLHTAKGLEFETVYLVGLEEGILPHANSTDNQDALEEERRLCYVGMTRARRELVLTTSAVRRVRGQPRDQVSSRFLEEIQQDLLEESTSPLLRRPFSGPGSSWASHPPVSPPAATPSSTGASAEPGSTLPSSGATREEALAALETHFGEKGRRAAERVIKRRERSTSQSSPPPSVPEQDTPESRPVFRRGDKVRHAQYGAGVVLSVEPVTGDQKLTVRFSAHGQKKFMASHAPLTYLLGRR